MATSTLVADHLLSGAGLVDHLERRGFPVAAACWAKPADDDRWDFYLVVEGVEKSGSVPVYRAVRDVLGDGPEFWLPASAVRVIPRNNSMASDILKLVPRYPGAAEFRGRRWLGDGGFEDVYVYPPPPPAREPGAALGPRRLRRAVRRQLRPADVAGPFTPQELDEARRLAALGVAADEARVLMWERRKQSQEDRAIPAGSVVSASYAAWLGDAPGDDSNPLLLVEADDGAQGLTFLDNTEAVRPPPAPAEAGP